MSTPQKSKYDNLPMFEPTIYSNDQGQDDEKAAAATYAQTYGGSTKYVAGSAPAASPQPPTEAPNVVAAYTTAPDLIPIPPSGSSGSAGHMAAGKFTIGLPTLLSSEQACLTATNVAIDGYHGLKDKVEAAAADPFLFGQLVGKDVQNLSDVQDTTIQPGDHVEYDALDAEGKQFAEAIVPQMRLLLQSVGGALEVMGAFNALLNNAGEMYATADANSKFPA